MNNKERSKNWYYKHKESCSLRAKQYYIDHPELRMKSRLKRFNLTIQQYNERFNNQNGCCAICSTHQAELSVALAVDHDHKCCPGDYSCGKCIRGLLCIKCNTMLGCINDSILLLTNAIQYVSGDE